MDSTLSPAAATGERCGARNIKWHHGAVTPAQRHKVLNQRGCVVWITGLSGSGKSTLACLLDHRLTSLGKATYVLDGDNIRYGLSRDLGFSAADREENIRRVGEVSKLFADAGIITLVSFISPYARDRDTVRRSVRPGEFVEVHLDVPLEVCEQRDVKGLYKLARAGKLKGFTGIDDPYERPEKPELRLVAFEDDGRPVSLESMAELVVDYLEEHGYLRGPCTANGL